jgi:hypothetical protein
MGMVEYSELPGSPQENWSVEGLVATVQLMCKWSERTLLCIEKLGFGGELYERFPDSRARARTAVVNPFGGRLTEAAPGFANYESAIVTITYNTKGADEREDGIWYEETTEPTAEYMTLDYNSFAWGASNGPALKDTEAPAMLQPGCDFRLTFPELAAIPPAVSILPGYVNQAAYTSSLGITCPAETLLFNLPVISETVKLDGTKAKKMDLRLTYKPTGWNRYWRAASGVFEYMYLKTGGIYRSYPPGDFSSIFA